MAKKQDFEETNETFKRVLQKLKDAGKPISYPVIVNTSNVDKDAWITCNFMGTGVHISLDEIDFNDFRTMDPEVFRHCATWTWTDKKKK